MTVRLHTDKVPAGVAQVPDATGAAEFRDEKFGNIALPYYVVVRVDPTAVPTPKAGGPAFMADLKRWNYVIGFGLIMIGLLVSASPDTPLGRNRGAVGRTTDALVALVS